MTLTLSVCRNFVQENESLVFEVCTLNELGYPLASTQGELTIIQKSFLIHGYQLYNKVMNENSRNDNNSSDSSSYSQRKAWKDKYKERQEQNRQRN